MRPPSSCLYLFGFLFAVSGTMSAPAGFPHDQHPRGLDDKDDLLVRGYNAGLVGQSHAGGAAGALAQGRINKGHARRDLDEGIEVESLADRQVQPGRVLFPNLGKLASSAHDEPHGRRSLSSLEHARRDLDEGIEASPLSDRDQVQSRAVHVSNPQCAGHSRRDLDEGIEASPLSDRDQVQSRAVHVSNPNLSPTDPRTHTAQTRKNPGCSEHARRDLDEGIEVESLSDRQLQPVQFPDIGKLRGSGHNEPHGRRSLSSSDHARRDLDEGIEASPLSDRQVQPGRVLFPNLEKLRSSANNEPHGRRSLSSSDHARRDLDEGIEASPLSDRDDVQPRRVLFPNFQLWPAGPRKRSRRDLDEGIEASPLSDREVYRPNHPMFGNFELWPAGPKKHNGR